MFIWRIIRRPRRKAVSSPEVLRLRAEAEQYLPLRLSQLSEQCGLNYNKVRIKHNVSNWGSCSSKKNINLNLNIMRLPADLQDYILLHELCHLKYMNHGPQFHALLESLCPGHRDKQRRLKEYKLI